MAESSNRLCCYAWTGNLLFWQGYNDFISATQPNDKNHGGFMRTPAARLVTASSRDGGSVFFMIALLTPHHPRTQRPVNQRTRPPGHAPTKLAHRTTDQLLIRSHTRTCARQPYHPLTL